MRMNPWRSPSSCTLDVLFINHYHLDVLLKLVPLESHIGGEQYPIVSKFIDTSRHDQHYSVDWSSPRSAAHPGWAIPPVSSIQITFFPGTSLIPHCIQPTHISIASTRVIMKDFPSAYGTGDRTVMLRPQGVSYRISSEKDNEKREGKRGHVRFCLQSCALQKAYRHTRFGDNSGPNQRCFIDWPVQSLQHIHHLFYFTAIKQFLRDYVKLQMDSRHGTMRLQKCAKTKWCHTCSTTAHGSGTVISWNAYPNSCLHTLPWSPAWYRFAHTSCSGLQGT